MKVSIVEVNPETVSRDLPELLAALPAWRLKKAMDCRFDLDRYLCAKAYLMLGSLIKEEFGIREPPPFSFSAKGKPYFREFPGIFFNLSHCRTGIACAVSRRPVGIDIEPCFFDRELAEHVLSPRELSDVLQSEKPERAMAQFWTRKESLLKLTGDGLADDMKEILADYEGKVCFASHEPSGASYAVTTAEWLGEN